MIQGKNQRTKKSTKPRVQEATEPQWPESTTGSPWWWAHGRAAWDALPCAPSALELFHFPSRLFDFLCGFLIGTDILCLKEGCIWPILECRIHSLDSLSLTLKHHWRNWKKRKQGQAMAKVFGCEAKDQHSDTGISFSELYFSFKFLLLN